jgi:hypothetical protein
MHVGFERIMSRLDIVHMVCVRRPVPGHPFGLSLAHREKMALIAFLRTL